MDWSRIQVENHYPNFNEHITRPTESDFDLMVRISKSIAKEFPFVRCDFYKQPNGFKFSEMTFYHWGATCGFTPSEYDCIFGDMLELPYKDNKFDCILCRNVISHTDTEGMKIIVSELKRVLKKDGECYLTLGSKDTWGFKQENWPLVDPNTRLRMQEGPEYKTPHFYADYNLCQELFKDFEIINIYQVIDYSKSNDRVFDSYHYHLLIKKR